MAGTHKPLHKKQP